MTADQALIELLRIREQIRCECCFHHAEAKYATEGDGTYWLCDSPDADHKEKYSGEEVFRFASMKLCECGTVVGGLHEFAAHPDCEYFEHHCENCHERGICTVPACVVKQ